MYVIMVRNIHAMIYNIARVVCLTLIVRAFCGIC